MQNALAQICRTNTGQTLDRTGPDRTKLTKNHNWTVNRSWEREVQWKIPHNASHKREPNNLPNLLPANMLCLGGQRCVPYDTQTLEQVVAFPQDVVCSVLVCKLSSCPGCCPMKAWILSKRRASPWAWYERFWQCLIFQTDQFSRRAIWSIVLHHSEFFLFFLQCIIYVCSMYEWTNMQPKTRGIKSVLWKTGKKTKLSRCRWNQKLIASRRPQSFCCAV